MARVETIRVVTWHVDLACGHTVTYRCAGWYPAALACPADATHGLSWTIRLFAVADTQVVQPPGTRTPPAALEHSITPPPDPEYERPTGRGFAPKRQTFTVTVAGSECHDGESPYDYVLWAYHLADAVTQAARTHLADRGEPDSVLTELGDDGLPHTHVTVVRTGAPVHPQHTPGHAWKDLRTGRGRSSWPSPDPIQ